VGNNDDTPLLLPNSGKSAEGVAKLSIHKCEFLILNFIKACKHFLLLLCIEKSIVRCIENVAPERERSSMNQRCYGTPNATSGNCCILDDPQNMLAECL
jgi:hypothetical protein